jgi:hypothetical protein
MRVCWRIANEVGKKEARKQGKKRRIYREDRGWEG